MHRFIYYPSETVFWPHARLLSLVYVSTLQASELRAIKIDACMHCSLFCCITCSMDSFVNVYGFDYNTFYQVLVHRNPCMHAILLHGFAAA